MTNLRILPLGDRGLLIELGEELSVATNARVRALARALQGLSAVEDVVPTLRSLLVVFDPLRGDPAVIAETAEHLAGSAGAATQGGGRLFEVPVVYGGEAGPDLDAVAGICGLTREQVVRAHSEVEYTVFMLGFTPGYPYLGILPDPLRVPRLSSPRLRVPRGSVAIADAMAGIYPLASPGGWHLLGRTPLVIYDPLQADPVVFRPGDRVRFTPVARAEFPEPPAEAPLPVPPHPVLEVRSPGLYTTVQDAGRTGYRALGIPQSGAMDPLSLQAANAAVGNDPSAPALELTAPGPVLRFLDHATIAVAGADLGAMVDSTPMELGKPTVLRPGQIVGFDAPRTGMWAYLAVAGGVDAGVALGSASTYVPGRLGGGGGRRLREGDIIGRGQRGGGRARAIGEMPAIPGEEVVLRVIPGPQEEWLTEEARRAILKEEFETTLHSDRAGARLAGPALAHRARAEFLSDGVLPGCVQVPWGGAPIIIMPDGPTTGGYPKPAAVTTADLRLVAQARPGTVLRMRETTMEQAVEALRAARDAYADR